jgi:hypothetical protein
MISTTRRPLHHAIDSQFQLKRARQRRPTAAAAAATTLNGDVVRCELIWFVFAPTALLFAFQASCFRPAASLDGWKNPASGVSSPRMLDFSPQRQRRSSLGTSLACPRQEPPPPGCYLHARAPKCDLAATSQTAQGAPGRAHLSPLVSGAIKPSRWGLVDCKPRGTFLILFAQPPTTS